MMIECKNTKKQGDIGMAVAMSWFVKNGYTVAVPLTDSQDYDLIVDDGEKMQRVQVRTSKQKTKTGGYRFGLRVLGGNQSWNKVSKILTLSDQIDSFFFVSDDYQMFWVPRETIKDKRSSITLGLKKYSEFQVL